jgi:hypothetical protein
MNELAKALTFLRVKQQNLATARRFGVHRDNCEKEVLAALSWVWDAQERALDAIDEEWRKSIARAVDKGGPLSRIVARHS